MQDQDLHVPRHDGSTELIEVAGQRIGMLPVEELARLAAHEYDDEAAVPLACSFGEQFLRAVAQDFTRFLTREGRFPTDPEIDELAGQATWHRRQATGSQVAQAFVDLGLFYSAHRSAAFGAGADDLRHVLDSAAGQLIFTLRQEYGPLG